MWGLPWWLVTVHCALMCTESGRGFWDMVSPSCEGWSVSGNPEAVLLLPEAPHGLNRVRLPHVLLHRPLSAAGRTDTSPPDDGYFTVVFATLLSDV